VQTIRLAIDNVVENIDRRSGQTKADKAANRPADRCRFGQLLSEYQGREHKYVLGPVLRTH
jgi:hypothetical protein